MNGFILFCIKKTAWYLLGLTCFFSLLFGMMYTAWIGIPALILAILTVLVPVIDDSYTEYTKAQARKKEHEDE